MNGNFELRISNFELRGVGVEAQPEAESVEIVVRTYEFALRVVKLCKHVAGNARFDGPIANQLLRSGTSVGAMVEEAQSAESRADFRHKLAIAAKESRETLYWLRLCKDAEIVEAERIVPLIQEATEIRNILRAIVKKLRADP